MWRQRRPTGLNSAYCRDERGMRVKGDRTPISTRLTSSRRNAGQHKWPSFDWRLTATGQREALHCVLKAFTAAADNTDPYPNRPVEV